MRCQCASFAIFARGRTRTKFVRFAQNNAPTKRGWSPQKPSRTSYSSRSNGSLQRDGTTPTPQQQEVVSQPSQIAGQQQTTEKVSRTQFAGCSFIMTSCLQRLHLESTFFAVRYHLVRSSWNHVLTHGFPSRKSLGRDQSLSSRIRLPRPDPQSRVHVSTNQTSAVPFSVGHLSLQGKWAGDEVILCLLPACHRLEPEKGSCARTASCHASPTFFHF